MADSITDCLARAGLARAAADAEPLENARQKHLASAEAWEAMALKAQRIVEGRETGSGETANGEASAAGELEADT